MEWSRPPGRNRSKIPALKEVAALAVTLLISLPTAAQAWCEYKGVMYAKTTIAEEYRDSEWVAKVRVVSAEDHWSDVEESWSLYKLQVLEVYKGTPPARLRFFTYRNSGGYYFDLPNQSAGTGGVYLVFLNQLEPEPDEPAAAKGAVFVNYPCGQSKPWREVTAADGAQLKALSRK